VTIAKRPFVGTGRFGSIAVSIERASEKISTKGLDRKSVICPSGSHMHRRHCEPTGRANARPMTGSAKQSSVFESGWIASSFALLAMTAERVEEISTTS